MVLPGFHHAVQVSASPCWITSRERMAGLVARNGAHWSTLDALTPAESLALMRRMLGAERVAGEPDAAAQLARLCANLPLALRIARELGDQRLQAQVLLDLADTHVRLCLLDEAEMEVADVLGVARQINSRLLERQAERVLPAMRQFVHP